MKPKVLRVWHPLDWRQWVVCVHHKNPVYFEHWDAAVAFAVYAHRHPGVIPAFNAVELVSFLGI